MQVSLILGILGVILLIVFLIQKFGLNQGNSNVQKRYPIVQEVIVKKKDYGTLQIMFGSQTGTAAKMAQTFAQQAEEQGFKPEVVDLKDIKKTHFRKNQISVFFMSNTGEGDPPDNSVLFMKMLNAKNLRKIQLPTELQGLTDQSWKNMSFTVFGLGNTQYEHYNKIGIDCDKLLAEKGATRVYKLGLGDNNASLQDDYVDWKIDLWEALKSYRQHNPLVQLQQDLGQPCKSLQNRSSQRKISEEGVLSGKYISKKSPIVANWRFVIVDEKQSQIIGQKEAVKQDILNFRTKAYLKAKPCEIINIKETRQNTKDGSSLQLIVRMPESPQYQTAANLALWPESDPHIIKEVTDYFGVKLDSTVTIEQLNDKKLSLNFVYPLTIRKLLQQHIDLQHKITKGTMKKLAKFQSKDEKYFIDNSNHRTTDEFKRITEKQQVTLIRLIRQFQVELTFEDFIELAQSVQPRLFTIASSFKAEKDIVVVASILKNGLISKHFQRKPNQIYAELRKSTFTDAMQWQKVIFVCAGTGFAPFRGYLKEKQLLVQKKQKSPIVTMFFGVKHYDGDYIYREMIQQWSKNGIIDRLHCAFSRDPLQDGTYPKQKTYVQHLLKRQKEELRQFFKDDKSALYLCGSLTMGSDVHRVLIDFLIEQMKEDQINAKQMVARLEKQGRFVKQLW